MPPIRTASDRRWATPNLRAAVSKATDRMASARDASMDAIEGERLRTQLRQMKQNVLRNWPDYLQELETNLRHNGCVVHWAEGIEDAQEIVKDIALQNSAKLVVKAKSMATEEIHLNQAMEQAGLRVVETDLGEYIIQLADEPPSHIVAPVIHKRLEEIADVFQEKLDMPATRDPSKMTSLARARLRNEFFSADMGISGCNFAIAETGTICIVTNEGNGRMVSSMPRVYVAVMGIEKLVPTVEGRLPAAAGSLSQCHRAAVHRLLFHDQRTAPRRRCGRPPNRCTSSLLDNGPHPHV